MRTWDAIIVGGGIIGLSLSLALRRAGYSVLVLDRAEPGREASYAAAGMLAAIDHDAGCVLQLAQASAALYPEFVRELEDSSGIHVDFQQGRALTIAGAPGVGPEAAELSSDDVKQLEPEVEPYGRAWCSVEEQWVDPRLLVKAVLVTAKHLGVDVHSGSAARNLLLEKGRVSGVRTERASYFSGVVVNSCGAWSAEIAGFAIPTRPVKGQMLDVVSAQRPLLNHVVRTPEVYLVPRRDGRIVIGATVEEAGFDKSVQPQAIQELHQAAANLVPKLGEARIHEAWAGLRPASPDDLPILGATPLPGYFAATGHYRNGILLAPITALCMAELIQGRQPQMDLSAFSPQRFVAAEELQRRVGS
ncbi:MAG TPA: glycine oxidase ThiO [Terriglobales bacterium]